MGMTCAACSARIEKAVGKVPGVTSCSVSLLTNSMSIEGNVLPCDIIKAVEEAGYEASVKSDSLYGEKKNSVRTNIQEPEDALKDKDSPRLLKRLAASLIFLLVLMYFSMGHSMLGLPLPPLFHNNFVALGLAELLLSAAVMVINQRFFTSGFSSLLRGSPNMDTLVALGSGASFLYSTVLLFILTKYSVKPDFYFEGAAMILTLITVGKILEARSKGKTTSALKKLISLAPKNANVIRGEKEILIPAEDILENDIFVVRPGESIPADGIIIEGSTSINESAITGESIPSDKKNGDAVISATMNQSGFIKCRATKVGTDTTLSKIIELVENVAATKAPAQKVADKVSGIFVPVVLVLAVLTTTVWLFAGKDFFFALSRGISILVISCPCALGLATPVAIMVGNGVGAKNGILFKTAASLEEAGKTKILALDKTGTITRGEPQVTDIIPAEGISEESLLQKALNIEAKSEHPLSKAILLRAAEKNLKAEAVTDFIAVAGNGLMARDNNSREIKGGNETFISETTAIPEDWSKKAASLSGQGKTPLFFVEDLRLLGIIGVADVIRDDSAAAISELKKLGIKTIMLTGDNEKTAASIAKVSGVDRVMAGLLPDEKAAAVASLKKEGSVAMVGDGINDAPALTAADTGIAIGRGTDIAIDAADIVLMKDSLREVVTAVRLSRATLRNIHENLFWAFVYNIIGIPLAAGAWIWLLGWEMNPMFGAAAMSLSSFCVVTNALRLNFFKSGNSIKNSTHKKEKKQMKKTLKVEGIMCAHCEARIKKALESVDGVVSAEASHETGKALVELSKDVSDEELKAAVEAQDYKVLGIE